MSDQNPEQPEAPQGVSEPAPMTVLSLSVRSDGSSSTEYVGTAEQAANILQEIADSLREKHRIQQEAEQ